MERIREIPSRGCMRYEITSTDPDGNIVKRIVEDRMHTRWGGNHLIPMSRRRSPAQRAKHRARTGRK